MCFHIKWKDLNHCNTYFKTKINFVMLSNGWNILKLFPSLVISQICCYKKSPKNNFCKYFCFTLLWVVSIRFIYELKDNERVIFNKLKNPG